MFESPRYAALAADTDVAKTVVSDFQAFNRCIVRITEPERAPGIATAIAKLYRALKGSKPTIILSVKGENLDQAAAFVRGRFDGYLITDRIQVGLNLTPTYRAPELNRERATAITGARALVARKTESAAGMVDKSVSATISTKLDCAAFEARLKGDNLVRKNGKGRRLTSDQHAKLQQLILDWVKANNLPPAKSWVRRTIYNYCYPKHSTFDPAFKRAFEAVSA